MLTAKAGSKYLQRGTELTNDPYQGATTTALLQTSWYSRNRTAKPVPEAWSQGMLQKHCTETASPNNWTRWEVSRKHHQSSDLNESRRVRCVSKTKEWSLAALKHKEGAA